MGGLWVACAAGDGRGRRAVPCVRARGRAVRGLDRRSRALERRHRPMPRPGSSTASATAHALAAKTGDRPQPRGRAGRARELGVARACRAEARPTPAGRCATSAAATARSSTARACRAGCRCPGAHADQDRRRRAVVPRRGRCTSRRRRRRWRPRASAVASCGSSITPGSVELCLVGDERPRRPAARCCRARERQREVDRARPAAARVPAAARAVCAGDRGERTRRRWCAAACRPSSSRATCRSSRSTRTRRTCARSCAGCAAQLAELGADAVLAVAPGRGYYLACPVTRRSRRQIDDDLLGRRRRSSRADRRCGSGRSRSRRSASIDQRRRRRAPRAAMPTTSRTMTSGRSRIRLGPAAPRAFTRSSRARAPRSTVIVARRLAACHRELPPCASCADSRHHARASSVLQSFIAGTARAPRRVARRVAKRSRRAASRGTA